MTGATNGVKEFDQGENLSQSSDVLALIDVYGLSDLAKIGHGYAKELEEEHYSASAPEELWLNGIATNSRTSGDVLTRNKPPRPTLSTTSWPPLRRFDHSRRPSKRVLPNQSELMRKVLSQKGADSKLIVVKGADRGEPQ